MNPSTSAEFRRRLAINEGVRYARYLDSRGIPTIATGYNLERGAGALRAVGVVDVDAVIAGRDSTAPHVARWRVAELRARGHRVDPASPTQTFVAGMTDLQIGALLDRDIPSYVASAASLLPAGLFDRLTPARQIAWADMAYNMGAGPAGLGGFHGSIALLVAGQDEKDVGSVRAHGHFAELAAHLEASAWYRQVGARAIRNVTMLRDGALVGPTAFG